MPGKNLVEHRMKNERQRQSCQTDRDRKAKCQRDLPFEGGDKLAKLPHIFPAELLLVDSPALCQPSIVGSVAVNWLTAAFDACIIWVNGNLLNCILNDDIVGVGRWHAWRRGCYRRGIAFPAH